MEDIYNGDLKTVADTSALQIKVKPTMVHTPILINQLPNRWSHGLKGPEMPK